MSNMPRAAFNQMRQAFQHKITLDSEWVVLRRIAVLTGIQPEWHDCCINSCVAYTSKYIYHISCPYCGEARRSPAGAVRRSFAYLPIIPQLRGYFMSSKMIDKLQYRSNYQQKDNTIADVFDSENYKKLRNHRVIIDGVKYHHRYFSDPDDIALGVCTDSYLLFKSRRGGPSATPILVLNCNIDPRVRTHLENLIFAGMIAGPKQPKDLGSFLAPLDDELALLAAGIPTFHAKRCEEFEMHAYCILELGDIVAMEKMLGIKGHNGFCPCRSCEITGVRMKSLGGKVYYVPLTFPSNYVDGRGSSWDPAMLPMRTRATIKKALVDITDAKTQAAKNKISMATGIREISALTRVGSLDHSRSAPWDWMHLFLENVAQNLIKLWIGEFKGLDTGTEDYELSAMAWQQIGRETKEATRSIPSAFVRALGNIAEDRSLFTAESWCFWFLHLAPILLHGRFKKEKYYIHACDFVRIIKISLRFTLTTDDVDELEALIISWVKRYERCVTIVIIRV